MDILVLPGDGIGPEITEATMTVMDRANARFGLGLSFPRDVVGFESLEKYGSTFRDDLAERFPTYAGVVLGPNQAADYPPADQGGINFSAFTRTKFDLYANIRPARTPPGIAAKGGDFDLIIVREVTEGHYSDRNMHLGHAEVMPDPDMVISMRKVTRKACERIAQFYHMESCGQCTPCREGTGWMHRLLQRIVAGQGKAGDLELLKSAAGQIEGHTICAFGEAAAEMTRAFRAVDTGDRITAWFESSARVRIFHNGTETGAITSEPGLFMDIWLGSKTRDEDGRSALLSGRCDG